MLDMLAEEVRVQRGAAIWCSGGSPVRSDKPPFEGREWEGSLAAQILGNIWNSSGFPIVPAHSPYRLLILKDCDQVEGIHYHGEFEYYQRARRAGTKGSRRKVADRGGTSLALLQMALRLISINSLPLSSLPEIKPSQLKDGGERR